MKEDTRKWLERHGWRFIGEKRNHFGLKKYWDDPETGTMVTQSEALARQQARNRKGVCGKGRSRN